MSILHERVSVHSTLNTFAQNNFPRLHGIGPEFRKCVSHDRKDKWLSLLYAHNIYMYIFVTVIQPLRVWHRSRLFDISDKPAAAASSSSSPLSSSSAVHPGTPVTFRHNSFTGRDHPSTHPVGRLCWEFVDFLRPRIVSQKLRNRVHERLIPVKSES